MIGERFGRLIVKEFSHTGNNYLKYFKCICDCGKDIVVSISGLRQGNTKSCGCLAKDKLKARRLPDNYGEITSIINGYKRNAKVRGFVFNLSREYTEKLLRSNCYYCGDPPTNVKKTSSSILGFYYSGIDRLNSAIGYEEGNVVPCCSVCNTAKSNKNEDSFLNWIQKIYLNRLSNKELT